MKKSLVFVLALVMVFAFATSAFAVEYTDISGQSQLVQDAIYKLSALNIVEGYEDNTWQPDGNITRAEFAKIACLAGGYGDSYASLTNTASPFTDVKVGVWYTGWINLAYSAGYIQGDGNGLFRPNDNISENEVITVLVRLLNYNDNLTGTWPVNYVRQAGVLGLLDDVSLTGNAAAKRSLVAVLTSEVLDEEMVVWSKDTDSFKPENDKKKVTLLSRSFSGTTADGYVEQAARGKDTVTAGWEYDDFDKGSMKVVFSNERKDGDELINKDALGAPMTVTSDFQVSGGYSIYDLAGHYGSAIYTVKSDKKSLAYFDVKSETIAAEKLEPTDNGKIKVDGKTYSVAKNEYYSADTDNIIRDLKDEIEGNYIVYLDEDGKIYDIVENGKWPVSVGVIDKVNTSTERLTYVDGSQVTTGTTVNGAFKDKNTIVFKNGEVTKGIDALKAGDVVSVTKFDEGEVNYAVIVLKETEAGKFTKANKQDLTIGGKVYTFADNAKYVIGDDDYAEMFKNGKAVEKVTDQFGSDASLVVGRTGKAVLMNIGDAKAGNNIYGILLDYTVSNSQVGSSQGSITSIKVFNQEGKTVTYDVDDDAYVTNAKRDDADYEYQIINRYAILNADYSVMKFKLNSDGVITKALDPALDQFMAADGEWKVEKDYKTMDGEDISDSVIAFNIVTKNNGDDIKSVSLLTKADLLKGDVSGKAGSSYILSSNKIAVATIIDFGRSSSGTYGIISDLGFSDSDFDPAILFANGDKYELGTALDAGKKDLVSYSVSGDVVTIEEILVDKSEKTPAGMIALTDVTAITSSRIKNGEGDSAKSYKYTNDTQVFDYSDMDNPVELTASDVSGLDKNSFDLYVIEVKGTTDHELDLIVIVEKPGDDIA